MFLEMFDIKLNKNVYFHTLEVVDRGSETQLQVGEKLNKTTRAWRINACISP